MEEKNYCKNCIHYNHSWCEVAQSNHFRKSKVDHRGECIQEWKNRDILIDTVVNSFPVERRELIREELNDPYNYYLYHMNDCPLNFNYDCPYYEENNDPAFRLGYSLGKLFNFKKVS